MSEKPFIVARCTGCKAAVFSCMNELRVLDKETRDEIAELVVKGYSVEHMTREEFKPVPFGCTCKKAS